MVNIHPMLFKSVDSLMTVKKVTIQKWMKMTMIQARKFTNDDKDDKEDEDDEDDDLSNASYIVNEDEDTKNSNDA